MKKNSILTDTGSAKKEVNKIIQNLNLKNISWIASHPIAGTENSGPKLALLSYLKKDGAFYHLLKIQKKKM